MAVFFDPFNASAQQWQTVGARWAIVQVPGAGMYAGQLRDDVMRTVKGELLHFRCDHVVRYVTQAEAEAASGGV